MQAPPQAPHDVVRQINVIEHALDDVVNTGSDDELFVASYLQGHFAVIARALEMDEHATLDALDDQMRKSLVTAFRNKELEEADQEQVLLLWQRLRSD
ncbi:YfcL family protein [Alteromonas sp. CYL-A6]|uniref:YfcL family protein n=1 Tax=Alteromonas nitratireducens TaxID=3390813 RepID=UPI0034AB6444